MQSPVGITRVIVVVLDGLRADALPLFRLPHLGALCERGAGTVSASTVRPSITAAALTSFFSGVAPAVHGVESDRFGFPSAREPLTLLPTLLQSYGVPTHVFVHPIPRAYRGVAVRLAAKVGVELTARGDTADALLAAAAPVLDQRGLHFLHWADADRAGHAHGWTSRAYQRAARNLDSALGQLLHLTGAVADPSTVLIAFADHGGGGAQARDHNSDHPLDTTIPIVLAGGQVAPGELSPGASLLDIPATIAWLFGIPQPANYAGRPLVEAFRHAAHPALHRLLRSAA